MIFKLLSFNIWFEPVDFNQRMENIAEIIRIHKPDLICLQEVIPSSFSFLQNRFSAYYFYPDKPSNTYFTVIMSKHLFVNKEFQKLSTTQARDFKAVEINLDGIPINLGVIHLESHFISPEFKLEQYNFILEYFLTKENAIIAGDTNITKRDEKYFVLPEPWKDIWIELGKDVRWQYSYDSKLNKYAEKPFRNRFDRIFYQGWDIYPISLKLVGTREREGTFPSDHFGLLAQFSNEN